MSFKTLSISSATTVMWKGYLWYRSYEFAVVRIPYFVYSVLIYILFLLLLFCDENTYVWNRSYIYIVTMHVNVWTKLKCFIGSFFLNLICKGFWQWYVTHSMTGFLDFVSCTVQSCNKLKRMRHLPQACKAVGHRNCI